MGDFFANLFSKKEPIVVVSERQIYMRKEDPQLEVLERLRTKVHKYETEIDQKQKRITQLKGQLQRVRGTLKGLPPEHPKVALARKQAAPWMEEMARLERECASKQQVRLTLQKQMEQHEKVQEVEEVSGLMYDSTAYIEERVSKLDIDKTRDTNSKTREVTRDIDKVSKLILDPYGIDVDEHVTTLDAEFDKFLLEGTNDAIYEEEEQDADILAPITKTTIPSKQQQQHTRTAAKREYQFDDELF